MRVRGGVAAGRCLPRWVDMRAVGVWIGWMGGGVDRWMEP